MFSLDERLKGLPATREQVVALHQSVNAPHLAIPGRKAGPARGYVMALRGGGGYALFVYLYLAESSDAAVYLPARRNLSEAEYPGEEAEALGFVESMGFLMDNLNFRELSAEDQDQLLKTLPIFQKDPRAIGGGAGSKGKGPDGNKPNPAVGLGKLFGSF